MANRLMVPTGIFSFYCNCDDVNKFNNLQLHKVLLFCLLLLNIGLQKRLVVKKIHHKVTEIL
jgi:hypothetical protein